MTTATAPERFAAAELDLDVHDAEAFHLACIERGWGDGLPMIPPTRARVERMLAEFDGDPQAIRGHLPTGRGAVTAELLAVQAVLAGCRPEAFPILVAAVDGVLDPAFNLHSIQATTHPVGVTMIVSGPIVQRVGVHAGAGCLGPGYPVNATLGRAMRLTLLHVGLARPGEGDRATHGQPGKFTSCFAERADANPFSSLAVDRGVNAAMSAVTVVGTEAPHNVNDHVGSTAAHIGTVAASAMSTTANNNAYGQNLGEMLLVLGPEHAATIAADGWDKDDLRHFLYERARIPLRQLKIGGMWGMHAWPAWLESLDDDDRIPVVRAPERFLITVAGGEGKHSLAFPTFASSRAVTTAIDA